MDWSSWSSSLVEDLEPLRGQPGRQALISWISCYCFDREKNCYADMAGCCWNRVRRTQSWKRSVRKSMLELSFLKSMILCTQFFWNCICFSKRSEWYMLENHLVRWFLHQILLTILELRPQINHRPLGGKDNPRAVNCFFSVHFLLGKIQFWESIFFKQIETILGWSQYGNKLNVDA